MMSIGVYVAVVVCCDCDVMLVLVFAACGLPLLCVVIVCC